MNAMQLTILIGSIVTVMAYALMFWVAGRRQGHRGKRPRTKISDPRLHEGIKGDRNAIEDKVGIQSIGANVIREKDGQVNVVLEYSTPDIPSLKEEELNLYENRLMRVAVALKCDIKTIEYAGTVKTIKANTHILNTVKSGLLSDQAAAYARQLATSLNHKQYDRREVEKKKYLVVGARGKSHEAAIVNLRKMVESIYTNLEKAGIRVHLMDTTQLIDQLNEIINFGSKLDVELAEEDGIFELISRGGIKRREGFP